MTLQISGGRITRKHLDFEDAEWAIFVHYLPVAPAGYHFGVVAIGQNPKRPQQFAVEAYDKDERFLGYCSSPDEREEACDAHDRP